MLRNLVKSLFTTSDFHYFHPKRLQFFIAWATSIIIYAIKLVSMADFLAFHAIDRALYSVLTAELRREPGESVEVMAFWILLERLGFLNFVHYMRSLEPQTVNSYADEAAACLRFINDDSSGGRPDLDTAAAVPMTFNLLRGHISLEYLHQNRAAIASKLEEIVSRVCSRAFADLVKEASEKNRLREREERTMFVTFSRGFPVDEEEARAAFSSLFGAGCVEALHMDRRGDPALYAFVVFSSADIVDRVLNGARKAKFTVNGKNLWLRKHVPR